MKTIIGVTALLFSFLSTAGYGAFLSTRLEPRFSYQDTDHSCVLTDIWRWIYLSARVEGGKVVEANLRDGSLTFIKKIEFQPSEMNGIEVAQDPLGKYYVTTLPLSARLLNWIFFYIDSAEVTAPGLCRPPQALATMSPMTHTYKFIEKEAGEYYTPTRRYEGTRADGAPYNIKLGFTERVVD